MSVPINVLPPTLLPPNATPLERALTQSGPNDHAALIPTLWNAHTCPEKFLPWLAWSQAVPDWEPTWGVDRKRAAIAESRRIHETQGTPAAIKRALSVRGHPDAILIERSNGGQHYDGSIRHDGAHRYGGGGQWATFRVVLKRPVTIDQAQAIAAMLETVKRNCCHLSGLDFTQAALRYNGAVKYDGSYTHGTVEL